MLGDGATLPTLQVVTNVSNFVLGPWCLSLGVGSGTGGGSRRSLAMRTMKENSARCQDIALPWSKLLSHHSS